MSWLKDIRVILTTVIVLALCGVGVEIWWMHSHIPPVGKLVKATPIPNLAKEKKFAHRLKTRTVQAYRSGVKHKIKLPKSVIDDPNQVVLASSIVKADTHDSSLTTVMDTLTGRTFTLSRRQPLPWLATNVHGSIWIGGGYSMGRPVMSADLQQNLFQIKGYEFTGRASVNLPLSTPGTAAWTVGVGVRKEW